jgi:RNA polymerase sigma-70 factor (ECF subfamily)
MMASEEFIERLKNRDRKAIEELYDQYSAALFGVIVRITKSPSEAEAVLERTFLKILEEIHTYKKHVSLFTWMFCMARAVAIENLPLSVSGARETQREDYKNAPAENDLEQFSEMPLLYQKVLTCLYTRGQTVSQASETLNISADEVKNHLRSGLAYICDQKSRVL